MIRHEHTLDVTPVSVQSCPSVCHTLHTDIHGVSNNDTDVAHYNFNAHQTILVIFGKDVAERVCYQTVICYLTSRN